MKRLFVIVLILAAFLLASCKTEPAGNPLYGTWECEIGEVTYRLDLRSDGWATFIRHADGVVSSIESYQWYADDTFLYVLWDHYYDVDEYSCDGKTLTYGSMIYTKK